MTFGEKLQRLRKSRGLSQEQLAAELQLTRQAISRWELNETIPDTENVIRLARFFAVTTDYLLLDEIEPPPRSAPPPGPPAAQGPHDPPPAEDTVGQKRLQTSVVGGVCICAIGLVNYVTVLFSHTPEMLMLGLIEQLCGIFLFEIIGAIYNGGWERRVKFYSAACWLLAPMPLYLSVRSLFRLKSWIFPSFGPWAVFYLSYLAACTGFTLVLRRIRNSLDG